jgi:hypothetical protein
VESKTSALAAFGIQNFSFGNDLRNPKLLQLWQPLESKASALAAAFGVQSFSFGSGRPKEYNFYFMYFSARS